MKKINTRFAPSPTGNLHIGNIKIAIYSWIFAKKNNGNFFLRIDDTYKKNNIYSKKIINQLKWLKIYYNNKIIYQSNRNNKYEKIIKIMLKNKNAYYCFCSKIRLNILKKKQILKKEKPKYDKFCKNLNPKEIKNNLKEKNEFVIRFNNLNNNNYIYFNDLIYGRLKFNNLELDDLIIKKSDGNFTYNFCSIIDDNFMNITHIIRGNDHISNTPRQINILKSLNFKIPKYIHIPITLNKNKEKISKKNNIFSINNFIKEGILPESILHLVTNSEINNKILSKKEIINNFNIKKINKSSSIFNMKKLLNINKLYLIKLNKKIIEKKMINYIINTKYKYLSKKFIRKLIIIFKNRFYSFKNLLNISKYIYENIKINISKIILNINKNKEILNIIYNIYIKLINIKFWRISIIKNILEKNILKFNNYKKKIYYIIRIIISGKDKTPELYNIIYLIGKENILYRFNIIFKKLII